MKESILIIILSIGLTSCSVVKEKTYTKTELTEIIDSVKVVQVSKEIDSISRVENTHTTKQINSSFSVRVNCDSLGNVKDFNYKAQSGKNTVEVDVKDNNFSLSINLDSITSVIKDKYVLKYRQDSINLVKTLTTKFSKEESLEVVREPISLFSKWIYYILAIALGWVIIPLAIKYIKNRTINN